MTSGPDSLWVVAAVAFVVCVGGKVVWEVDEIIESSLDKVGGSVLEADVNEVSAFFFPNPKRLRFFPLTFFLPSSVRDSDSAASAVRGVVESP